MLVDAILQKMFNLPPEYLIRGFLIVLVVVGLAASLAPAIFFQLLELTPGAKRRGKRDLNAELQGRYDSVCRELHEKSQAFEELVLENQRLVSLLREEHAHNRDWDLRTRRALDDRKVVG